MTTPKLAHRGFESGIGPEQSLPTQIGARTNDHAPAPPLGPGNKDRGSMKRKRKRIPGSYDRLVKNTASAKNAKPKSLRIVTGLASKTLHQGRIDRRTTLGRLEQKYIAEYRAHVGEMTIVADDLCRMAARKKLLAHIAYAKVYELGVFDGAGNLQPAFDAFRKASSDLLDVLRLLGLERRQKQVLDVAAELSRMPTEDCDGSS